MKRLLFLSIIINLMVGELFSQCGLREQVVPGTNKKVLISKSLTMAGGWDDSFTFLVTKIDSVFIFSGYFSRSGLVPSLEIDKQCPLVYVINEKERIILSPLSELKIKESSFGAHFWHALQPILGEQSAKLSYIINPEQINQLATTDCKEIHLYFKSEKKFKWSYSDDLGRYFKLFYYKKGQMKIFQPFQCLLSQQQ